MMTDDDSQAEAVPESDLPKEDQIQKPVATDDVRVPAPDGETPQRPAEDQ